MENVPLKRHAPKFEIIATSRGGSAVQLKINLNKVERKHVLEGFFIDSY